MGSNLRISGVEKTQTIQYFNFPGGQGSGFAPDNSLPLANRKTTLLRVYVDARPNDPAVPVPATVDGIVWAYNPDTGGGGVYHSASGPVTARDASTIQRATSGQTLDFLLPWTICQGQVLCEIAVYDPANWQSPNRDNSFLTVDLVEVPALRMHSVLIHYTGLNYYDQPVDARTTAWNTLFVADFLLRIYPVSDFVFDGCEVLEWNAQLKIPANFYRLKSKLDSMQAMSGTNDLYIGLIPPAANCSSPCGLGGGTALFFSDDTLEQFGAAHEIGHALRRAHTPQCTNIDVDPNYPQYDGFPRDSIGECGVDMRGRVLFDPRSTVDYMSYCPVQNWTSPYGYLQILQALQSGLFTAALSATTATPSSYHYLSFEVHSRGQDSGQPQVRVTSSFCVARNDPPLRGRADQAPSVVSVELLDADGGFLHALPCDPQPHVDRHSPFEMFKVHFPDFRELGRVRLARDGAVLGEFPVASEGPHLSDVRMERDGQLIRLTWQAEYREETAPAMEFGVRFSSDGNTWRPVVSAGTEPSAVLDITLLPGGEECRIQIVASAGFRTTVHETDAFSLPRKPCTAYIVSPTADAEYVAGEPITFSGTGFSPDFGNARPDEITWTSLAAGPLGSGHSITTTGLPVGHHWITVHVPDGLGGLATASVPIRVVPRTASGGDRGGRSKPRPGDLLQSYRDCGCG